MDTFARRVEKAASNTLYSRDLLAQHSAWIRYTFNIKYDQAVLIFWRWTVSGSELRAFRKCGNYTWNKPGYWIIGNIWRLNTERIVLLARYTMIWPEFGAIMKKLWMRTDRWSHRFWYPKVVPFTNWNYACGGQKWTVLQVKHYCPAVVHFILGKP